MARAISLEASLERLADIRNNPDAPGAVEQLRSIIAGKHSHAVATAADIDLTDSGYESVTREVHLIHTEIPATMGYQHIELLEPSLI